MSRPTAPECGAGNPPGRSDLQESGVQLAGATTVQIESPASLRWNDRSKQCDSPAIDQAAAQYSPQGRESCNEYPVWRTSPSRSDPERLRDNPRLQSS